MTATKTEHGLQHKLKHVLQHKPSMDKLMSIEAQTEHCTEAHSTQSTNVAFEIYNSQKLHILHSMQGMEELEPFKIIV
jgi:hypothetical protein